MTKLHATSVSPSAWRRPSRRLSHVRRSACRYSASKYPMPTSTSCLCRPRATWTSDARSLPSRRTRCAPSPTRYTRHSHPQNNDLQGCKSSALTDHNIEATVSRCETVASILQKNSFHDTPNPTRHLQQPTSAFRPQTCHFATKLPFSVYNMPENPLHTTHYFQGI